VGKNFDLAFSWAFNLPRNDWWGQWQHQTRSMLSFLRVFRIMSMVLILILILLTRTERNLIIFGMVWFLVTLTPALPLLDHFIPYYLFLPLAGLSMTIGIAFVWIQDKLQQVHAIVGPMFLIVSLGGVLIATSHSISADIQQNRLLGGSAEYALNSLTDIKRLQPALRPNQQIFFDDAAEPIYWDQSWGGLIRMGYDRDDIIVNYASLGDPLFSTEVDDTLVMAVRNKHLVDRTSEYLRNPKSFLRLNNSDVYKLELSTDQVIAGKGAYTLRITGIHDQAVTVAYKLNKGHSEAFRTQLNRKGEVSLEVSRETRKGTYRFIAFKIGDNPEWIRTENTVFVR